MRTKHLFLIVLLTASCTTQSEQNAKEGANNPLPKETAKQQTTVQKPPVDKVKETAKQLGKDKTEVKGVENNKETDKVSKIPPPKSTPNTVKPQLNKNSRKEFTKKTLEFMQ